MAKPPQQKAKAPRQPAKRASHQAKPSEQSGTGRGARSKSGSVSGPEISGAPIAAVADALSRLYPDARTELDHRNAFELVVATVLSAQTTDRRVNIVTVPLFAQYPGPEQLAEADPSEVEAILKPIGMAPTKARRIIELSRQLLTRHHGEVPAGQQELEALAGVGRKTALVVRGAWFGKDAFAVDTHVGRLARRLGWTAQKDPVKVEHDVLALRDRAAEELGSPGEIPEDLRGPMLSLRLILHGRRVCFARNPACDQCALRQWCPTGASREPTGKAAGGDSDPADGTGPAGSASDLAGGTEKPSHAQRRV